MPRPITTFLYLIALLIAGLVHPFVTNQVRASAPAAEIAITRVGSVAVPNAAIRVKVSNGIAYVVDGASRKNLVLIDVRDPTTPKVLSNYPAPGEIAGMEVIGARVYLSITESPTQSGIQVIDASDPSQPRLVTRIPRGTGPLLVQHTTAYVLSAGNLFRIVDISDLNAPHDHGSILLQRMMYAMDVVGQVAYLTGENYRAGVLHIVDISNPDQPLLRQTVQLLFSDTEGRAIQVVDGFAYIAALGSAGVLYIVDVRDQAAESRGFYLLDASAEGIQVRAKRAYLVGSYVTTAGAGAGRLRLLDVHDPDKPVVMGQFDDLKGGHDVAVQEPYIYIAAGNGGLDILRLVLPYRTNLPIVSR